MRLRRTWESPCFSDGEAGPRSPPDTISRLAPAASELLGMEFQQRAQQDEPSPLRIVKRYGSADTVPACRASSFRTNGSCPSSGADATCLTIMKRRNKRISLEALIGRSEADQPSPRSSLSHSRRQSWEDVILRSHRLAGPHTLNIRKTRRPHPFINNESVNLEFGCAQTIANCSNKRKRIPWARESLLFEPQARTAKEQRSMSSYSHHTDPCLAIENSQRDSTCSKLRASTPLEHCILCPHVAVTTEVTAMDSDHRHVWAAIEVSGRLSKLRERATFEPPGVVKGSFIEHELGSFDLVHDVCRRPWLRLLQTAISNMVVCIILLWTYRRWLELLCGRCC